MALDDEQQNHARNYIRARILTTMSQVELARRTGYSQNMISQIMTGNRNVTFEFAQCVNETLGVNLVELLGLETATEGLPKLGELPGWRAAERDVRRMRPETPNHVFDAIRGGQFAPCPEKMTASQLLMLVQWASEAFAKKP